ncbi:MAG TPA: hypothetical protein VFR51_00680 [Pyrinomonadaceae bacterium]|nr:hypothetical protein [Pyrinomonadaceae bacterium]
MARINWGRLILGGLIAAIILFFTDGFIHERLVRTDWHSVYAGLKAAEPEPHGASMAYFALYELGRGLIALLFYATMRTHFGAGPKTAVLAAIATWIAFSVAGPAQFIPLGFFSDALWLKVGALHLVTTIIATIAGAAIYKDAAQPATA